MMYEGVHEGLSGNSLFVGCAMLISLHSNGKVHIHNKTLCKCYIKEIMNWLKKKR